MTEMDKNRSSTANRKAAAAKPEAKAKSKTPGKTPGKTKAEAEAATQPMAAATKKAKTAVAIEPQAAPAAKAPAKAGPKAKAAKPVKAVKAAKPAKPEKPAKPVEQSPVNGAEPATMSASVTVMTVELRCQMVADAAYFRAEQRGFMGGDPFEDWLAAEREIDALYFGDTDL